MDYTTLTDDELLIIRRDVTIEQDRRAALAEIPDQIAALATEYRVGGGDDAVLLEAVTPDETVQK